MSLFLISKLDNNIDLIHLRRNKSFEAIRMKKRLSELKVGKLAVITEFENDDIFLKLMEMGCIPGETIKIDQIAPLGDPISITVAGYHLSLRLDEAEKIWVEESYVANPS
jgi:ferrous iron transport protein A